MPSSFIFMQPLYEYSKGIFTMLTRLGGRLINLPATRRDTLARVMMWELGFWLSLVWMNWSILKKNWPLLGVLPVLLLGGNVVAVWHGSSMAFLFMFGCTVVLMVLFSQQLRERYWEQHLVGYSEFIREHSTRAALYLSLILVVASGLLASIDFEALIEKVREYRQGTSADVGEGVEVSQQASFNPEKRTLQDEFDTLSVGGFPMVNLVGAPPDLAEHVVMYVEVEEMDPASGQYQPVTAEDGAIYLRSLTYERYNTHGWFADTRRVYLYDPGQEAVWAYSTNQRLLRQHEIFVHDFRGLLGAVGQVAAVDIQYTIGWREGSSPANFKDMVGAMVPESEFSVYSISPVFGEEELRNISGNYPDWVSERYLDLPDEIPDRVYQLAEEITAGQPSVYDKAAALEQYLRSFPYTLDLPEHPVGRDIVDYFLFDLKKGYCDYYASSMVVMARHLGIPARLAVGYVTRNYDDADGHFVVTADQAHSWVEIYFPGYGWVTFEPTAGREAIARLQEREQGVPAQQTYQLVADKITNPILKALPRIIGISLAVILLLVGLYLQVNLWWLRRKQPADLFVALYRRLQRFAQRLEVPNTASQTPGEFSDAFGSCLQTLWFRYPMRGLFTSLEGQVRWLVQQYVQAAYSPSPPGMIERSRALREWRGIRRRLAIALALRRLADLRIRLQPKMIRSVIENFSTGK
jgi:transglutaminase-like putative cysteine protease